jgi:hypothetical protein
MKLFISLLTFLLIFSCGGESKSSKSDSKSRSSNTSSSTYSKKKAKTNNGTYSKETIDGKMTVTISGNSWRGKTVIKTGFGDAYDNQNAQYDRGLVKGNDLYDESGYVKIGSVSGNSVRMAGYTLYK